MKNIAYKFIINFSFIRVPFGFLRAKKSQDSTEKELINMHRDLNILCVMSLVFSSILSGYLYWYYQLPYLWCIVLFFYNSQIISIVYCFIYRYNSINYNDFFIDNYLLIKEKFKRNINSTASWFLTSLFPISVYNNIVHSGSRWESLVDIFFWIYLFVTLALYFIRYYLFKKFL